MDYVQTNRYNGYGQRVEKSETVGTKSDTTKYYYDGSQILYTADENDAVTSFNMVGAEDNIILTGRPGETADADPEFYVYTKDIRESTTNVIGTDGTAAVSYSYDTFGETTEYQQDETDPFYNEICYTAGVYDKTTGLYNLSARYYDPETGVFLSQDTYRGSRSRTATLNYYAYCAGNPVSYTDPSGHAFWAVAGAAMGAYDGYKYARKKNLKGWKKGAAIVGGALLGAVNPFKIVGKAGKAYKAVKAVKTAKKAKKTTKAVKAVTKTPKKTVVTKKVTKAATKGNKTIKTTGVVKAQIKQIGSINSKLTSNRDFAISNGSRVNFASTDKLNSHFEKHADEFEGTFKTPQDYLDGARDVIKNGYKVEYSYKNEQRIGYVQFYGNSRKNGNAKFAFVGTNLEGNITTFHIESGRDFWKMLNGANIKTINPK